jgi:hypothetical protein
MKAPRDRELAELQKRIDEAKPDRFLQIVAGKIMAGEVSASSFVLVDPETAQPRATLGGTTTGDVGLALFDVGSNRARVELLLTREGPELRLNDRRGRARASIRYTDSGRSPALALMGPRGKVRLAALVDEDRPHILTFPPGTKGRHAVPTLSPEQRGKEPRVARAWKRAQAAARKGQRAAFDRAARDSGFLTPEIPALWKASRRRLRS